MDFTDKQLAQIFECESNAADALFKMFRSVAENPSQLTEERRQVLLTTCNQWDVMIERRKKAQQGESYTVN